MIRQPTSTRLIVAALAATIAVFLGPDGKLAAEQHVVIEIRSLKFAPAASVLNAGDVVVWINHDIVPHTVTAADGSWDSGEIEPGGEWRMVVEETQVAVYFCSFHPSMKARLTIARTDPPDQGEPHLTADLRAN